MTLLVALANHDEVVALGLAATLSRYGRDIHLDALRPGSTTRVDLVLHDPASATADRDGAEPLALDPRVGRLVAFTWDVDRFSDAALAARGYDAVLSIRAPGPQIVGALHAVHRGRLGLDPTADDATPAPEGPGPAEGLTVRETDVLVLIADGLSNREISDRLGLSINSVKSYVRGAYRSIGVDSRTKAVLWCVTHGLTTPTRRAR